MGIHQELPTNTKCYGIFHSSFVASNYDNIWKAKKILMWTGFGILVLVLALSGNNKLTNKKLESAY